MLSLYRPEYKDLWFREMMLADEKTMSYNHAYGSIIPFPEERWRSWYDKWIIHHEGLRYYRYLKDATGHFVGEISYHYDDDHDEYLMDVIILSLYRNKGYGSKALDMLCEIAKENGIKALCDDLASDNPALGLFLKHGFREISRNDDVIFLKKEL